MIVSLAIAASALAHHLPPAQYDYEPTQPYTITDMPRHFLEPACQNRPPAGLMLYGCAIRESNMILILEGLSPADRAIIVRHEKAHLNGWNHD